MTTAAGMKKQSRSATFPIPDIPAHKLKVSILRVQENT